MRQTAMFALALVIGLIAGGGAWVFRMAIGLVHNIFFMTHNLVAGAPFSYNANEHTPPPVNGIPLPLIVLSPIMGGLIVAFLVKTWAPEAKGHGVPEVMDAIHYKKGVIRPSVAFVKILASSFSIGSGGSVGREGPIIQIGSTCGSMVGVASGCSIPQRVTLIACGAAGGIAATFNTPIGGMAFAVELMLPAANSRTLMPIGITAVVATYVGRTVLGLHPAFDIPELQKPESSLENTIAMLCFVPFGVVMGLVSVLFIKAIYWSEDFFEAMPGNYYTRHSLGMLGQGLLVYLFMQFAGHYYVQGVGYSTIKDLLEWQGGLDTNYTGPWQPDLNNATDAAYDGGAAEAAQQAAEVHGIANPTFCLLLFFAKLLSTNLTIGSGASGGIFSPSLYVGATLGAAWGHILAAIDLVAVVAGRKSLRAFDPIQSVVAGMAGMVGGSTGASLTAITMTFEMTRDYSCALPIIITTVMAHMTRKAISEDSIYTLKLVRRGHVVPEGLQAAVHAAQRVQDVMTSNYRNLGPNDAMTPFDGVSLVLDKAPPPSGGDAPAGGGAAAVVTSACGALMVDYERLLGRPVTAAAHAAEVQKVATGGAAPPPGCAAETFCVVDEAADLHDAIRQMNALGAELLIVAKPAAAAAAAADASGVQQLAADDVVGVVTAADISDNVAAKSHLMARDRTLTVNRSVGSNASWP